MNNSEQRSVWCHVFRVCQKQFSCSAVLLFEAFHNGIKKKGAADKKAAASITETLTFEDLTFTTTRSTESISLIRLFHQQIINGGLSFWNKLKAFLYFISFISSNFLWSFLLLVAQNEQLHDHFEILHLQARWWPFGCPNVYIQYIDIYIWRARPRSRVKKGASMNRDRDAPLARGEVEETG